MSNSLIIDNFAGAGGASTGIEAALGRPISIAVNHNALALAMHERGEPERGGRVMIATHYDGCWKSGPKHYECAVRHYEELARLYEIQRAVIQEQRACIKELVEAVSGYLLDESPGFAGRIKRMEDAIARAQRALDGKAGE
jgi:site-specific DNA-cytosine methylase